MHSRINIQNFAGVSMLRIEPVRHVRNIQFYPLIYFCRVNNIFPIYKFLRISISSYGTMLRTSAWRKTGWVIQSRPQPTWPFLLVRDNCEFIACNLLTNVVKSYWILCGIFARQIDTHGIMKRHQSRQTFTGRVGSMIANLCNLSNLAFLYGIQNKATKNCGNTGFCYIILRQIDTREIIKWH